MIAGGDSTADATACRRGAHDRRNCLNAGYPCFDRAQGACYDLDGRTQLFDPIADFMRPVSQLVDYLISTSTGLPRDRKRELYALMNDYVTTFVPIQNRVLATLDLPRYYDVQPYVRDARKAGRRLTAAVNRMISQ